MVNKLYIEMIELEKLIPYANNAKKTSTKANR